MTSFKNHRIQTKLVSSLEKIFSDEELHAQIKAEGSMLLDEVYSFQAAYRLGQEVCASSSTENVTKADSPESEPRSNQTLGSEKNSLKKQVKIKVDSELSPYIQLRRVVEIQSDLPCYEDHDDNYLRTTPGLYPDLLLPIGEYVDITDNWQAIWVTVNLKGVHPTPGDYYIKVIFEDESNQFINQETFKLKVIGSTLPKQRLIHTQWFHTDCLATLYGDDVFSEAHWSRIEQYIKTAVDHGINMILTPIFTPPLDTQVGGERPTVQLIDVIEEGGNYSFGFDRLKRWVELCNACNVEYFEFSHLFTQWGAKHAPKIVAKVDGEDRKIFGWETDAAGAEYENFLDQFLPSLVRFIKENQLEGRSYFHVSDEPQEEHLDSYANASRILYKHLAGYPVIDALSSYTYYEKGLVKRPIPATDHIEPFLEHGVPDLWTYYCCGQFRRVANRFFSMPSARNRILGIQLYKFNMAGFLQWGFNFWYSQYSIKPIDPFKVTDAGKAFPSGDPFMVYPGEEGPLESIRLEVFYDALQDLRALYMLEGLIGRDSVIKMLEEDTDNPITFSEYPTDAQWLINKREAVNMMISELVKA